MKSSVYLILLMAVIASSTETWPYCTDVEVVCSFLIDPASPFQECLNKMTTVEAQKLLSGCLSAYCSDGQEGVCDHVAEVKVICEDNHQVTITTFPEGCEPPTTTPPPTTTTTPVSPACQDFPGQDDAAIEACKFIIDAASGFNPCTETLTQEYVKEWFLECTQLFCSEGMDSVCDLADRLAAECATLNFIVTDRPDGCEPPTTTTTPELTTPVSPACQDFPGQDEAAIEACNFIIDAASGFNPCIDILILDEVKDWFLECTHLFCSEGMDSVCDLADRLAAKCATLNAIVTDRPDVCEPTTTTTTTAEPTACSDTQIDEALAVCSFVMDPQSEFYPCTSSMSPAELKAKKTLCRETYCLTGQACDVANGLAHACEAAGYGVITERPAGCICSLQYLDIIIVVDTSLSVDEVELDKMRNFINQVASAFDISDSTSRMGLINYADDVHVEVDLVSSNSNPAITQIALNMQRRPCFGACTWTPAGLDKMSHMFNTQGGSSPKVGILLTDGFSNIGNLPAAIANIPSDVTMFAVGVVAASHQQLLDIASDDSRVFQVANFDGLSTIIESLMEEICV